MRPNPGLTLFLGALSAMVSLAIWLSLSPRLGADLSLLLALSLLVLSGLGLVARYLRQPRVQIEDNAGQDFSVPYQKQMQRVRSWIYPSLCIFALSLSLLGLFSSSPEKGTMVFCPRTPDTFGPAQIALLITAVCAITMVITGLLCWARCPACGQLPPGSGGNTGGVPLHLDTCPRCAAILSQAGGPP